MYMKTCDLCGRTKPSRHKPYGELHLMPIPDMSWDVVSVDFISELPDAHGYDAIMNVVDFTTKQAHFMATHTIVSAEGAAQLFLNNVWKLH